MRVLTEVLPLVMTSARSSGRGKAPVIVTICGMPLPTSILRPVDGHISRQEAQVSFVFYQICMPAACFNGLSSIVLCS